MLHYNTQSLSSDICMEARVQKKTRSENEVDVFINSDSDAITM